ncbi:MAG: hypothetical protein NT144_13505 [Bacteroidia bacterium]|nr:hypothetical protein [Bacteroidia bacterium]
MTNKHIIVIVFSIFIVIHSGFSQEKGNTDVRFLFHGLVMDANTLSPIANSQIMINTSFSSVSGEDGTFAFYVYRNDTVIFKSLGYKSTVLFVSDTLTGTEFIAGVYLNTDTLSIGEVVIVPRQNNLKSDIMNTKSMTSVALENARYNVAVSAYAGRNSQSKLGSPEANYEILRQREKVDAYERGGIPSDRIVGISPLLLIPAAYLLIHGLPGKPDPLESQLTDHEVDQIQKKYFETLKQRK